MQQNELCLSYQELHKTYLETFSESAISALVPFVLVHRTVPVEPAAVGMLLPHASPEETFATVAGGGAVVLASGTVTADGTVGQKIVLQ